MTSVSPVPLNTQPCSVSFRFSSGALTMFPLWAAAIRPRRYSMTMGWVFS